MGFSSYVTPGKDGLLSLLEKWCVNILMSSDVGMCGSWWSLSWLEHFDWNIGNKAIEFFSRQYIRTYLNSLGWFRSQMKVGRQQTTSYRHLDIQQRFWKMHYNLLESFVKLWSEACLKCGQSKVLQDYMFNMYTYLLIGAKGKLIKLLCVLGLSIGLPQIGDWDLGSTGDVLATKLNRWTAAGRLFRRPALTSF